MKRILTLAVFSVMTVSLIGQKSQQQADVMSELMKVTKEGPSGYPSKCPVPLAADAQTFYLFSPADVMGVWCEAQVFKSIYVVGAVKKPGAYVLGGVTPLARFKSSALLGALIHLRPPRAQESSVLSQMGPRSPWISEASFRERRPMSL
jgi:hypothetical protein